jgi:hypothetical protein
VPFSVHVIFRALGVSLDPSKGPALCNPRSWCWPPLQPGATTSLAEVELLPTSNQPGYSSYGSACLKGAGCRQNQGGKSWWSTDTVRTLLKDGKRCHVDTDITTGSPAGCCWPSTTISYITQIPATSTCTQGNTISPSRRGRTTSRVTCGEY